MKKLFYSGTYNVRHELINEDNVLEMLKDDIRSKIVGSVKDVVYSSDGVVLKNNKNVMYIGGYYYEKKHKNKGVCESVVEEELYQIDKCDIVICNLMKYSAIASISELMYASYKQKEIIIFCNPDITGLEVNKEYWFPILTSLKLNRNIKIIYTKDEKDIIDYIYKLK